MTNQRRGRVPNLDIILWCNDLWRNIRRYTAFWRLPFRKSSLNNSINEHNGNCCQQQSTMYPSLVGVARAVLSDASFALHVSGVDRGDTYMLPSLPVPPPQHSRSMVWKTIRSFSPSSLCHPRSGSSESSWDCRLCPRSCVISVS